MVVVLEARDYPSGDAKHQEGAQYQIGKHMRCSTTLMMLLYLVSLLWNV